MSATLNQDESFTSGQERDYQRLRGEIVELVNSMHLHNNRIEQLVDQLYGINRQIMTLDGAMVKLADQARINRQEFIEEYRGAELEPGWLDRVGQAARPAAGTQLTTRYRDKAEEIRHEMAEVGQYVGARHLRVPPHREPGAEGREGSPPGQEGDGRGQPAPRDLDRQEIHQPRPAVPRPDPGRQHRPDEGGRQVRVPPRLQVLDLRHLVDPPGDHPLDRRPGPHHPHPGAHDRDDQQAGPHRPADAARDRPRADARGAGREAADAAREGPQGDEDRQGADLASRRRSATRRTASSATSSRTRTRSCRWRARSRAT